MDLNVDCRASSLPTSQLTVYRTVDPSVTMSPRKCFVLVMPILIVSVGVLGTPRYYGTYLRFGTGETFINTQHAHGGPKTAFRKWNVECLDGEAMTSIRDFLEDFQRLSALVCKFMFPYKPPTGGLYPYYNFCHVRNLTTESFCFDPTSPQQTLNTFVTGIYDNEFQFRVDRTREDATSMYKCCRTPPGYYIDYTSCNYKPTHDQYFEYYDDLNHGVVYCDTGFVMTGMAKKINPWDSEYHMDWIQCCRVGFDITNRLPSPMSPATSPQAPLNYKAVLPFEQKGLKWSSQPDLRRDGALDGVGYINNATLLSSPITRGDPRPYRENIQK